jgi:hypothetical protein
MAAALLPRFLASWVPTLPEDISPDEVEAWVEQNGGVLEKAIARASLPKSQRARKSCQDVCDLAMEGSLLCGAKTSVHLASETGTPRYIPARWCLVRASSVRASNDPIAGFKPTPGYPQGTQERRYGTDAGEQNKVLGIARNPRPELIYNTGTGATDGTPIVTTTGIALGGNGRTMGTQLHYHHGGQVIGEYVREVAPDFGFNPDEVEALTFEPGDGPMIVRVIDLPEPEWPAAVRALNVPLTQALDAAAEAVAFAKQIPSEAFSYLATALGDNDMTLTEFLLSHRSRPFVDALRRTGLITAQNATRMLGDGVLLSEAGRSMVSSALAAALSPDPDLLDAANVELRNALARSAPYWLAAASYGGAWDLRTPLDKAIRDYLSFKSSKGFGGLQGWLAQGSLEPRKTAGDPLAERLLVLLDKNRGPIQLSKIARHFMTEAAANGGGQTTMFVPKSPLEVLHEQPGAPQVALFAEGMARAEALPYRSDDEILAGRDSYGEELDRELLEDVEFNADVISNWERQDRVAALARHPRELIGPLVGGGTQVITREPGAAQWRVTRFDADMQPIGHFGPSSFAQVVDVASFDGPIQEFRPFTAERLPRSRSARRGPQQNWRR